MNILHKKLDTTFLHKHKIYLGQGTVKGPIVPYKYIICHKTMFFHPHDYVMELRPFGKKSE